MLLYEQICLECGKLQKRIRIEPGQNNLLFLKVVDNCFDCGSDNLKTELINKHLSFFP